MRITALSFPGWTTFARIVPGTTHWPGWRLSSDRTPSSPGRTCSELSRLSRNAVIARKRTTCSRCTASCESTVEVRRSRRCFSMSKRVSSSLAFSWASVTSLREKPPITVSESATAASRVAWRYRVRVDATTPACVRRAPCRLVRKFTRSPSAAVSWRCASSASIWTSGFASSSSTVFACTGMPGWTKMRSTRAGVSAEIQRMCSGTSVPGPRTSRTIVPRRTPSSDTISRSTLGAAGFKLASRIVMRRRPPAATPPCTYRLRFLVGARGMSTGSRQGTDRTRPPCRLTRDLGRDCVWSLLCDRSVVGLSRPRSRELSDDVACGSQVRVLPRELTRQQLRASWPRVWPNRYRGGWEAIRFSRQSGRPGAGARADDDERLAVEEPHCVRLERGVADLITVVNTHDTRVTSDPKPNQRLGVQHRHTRAVLHGHRDERQIVPVRPDPRTVGSERDACRRTGGLHLRRHRHLPRPYSH